MTPPPPWWSFEVAIDTGDARGGVPRAQPAAAKVSRKLAIRQAAAADLPAVTHILQNTARWLHERGIDQWPPGLPSLGPDQIAARIAQGETYLVTSEHGDPIATITAAASGDPDYWNPAELAEPAVYISKAAVIRSRAGEGLGALVLRWIIDQAAVCGTRWARLDTSKTNPALQAYYQAQGWTYLRTADTLHRRGGVLFQRAAAPDLEARAALIWQEAPTGPPWAGLARRITPHSENAV
jgi:antitoxin (DNA-binding transcriptional repressor) of toxin-antitoxin stability system